MFHPSKGHWHSMDMDVFWNRYGPVLVGLAIGTAGRYGLDIRDGRKFTWTTVIADLMLLGLVALLALVTIDWMGLHGDTAVLCAALFAIASDRGVRIARDAFLARVSKAASQLAEATQDDAKDGKA